MKINNGVLVENKRARTAMLTDFIWARIKRYGLKYDVIATE